MRDEDRQKVIAAALSWVRTPYHHRGRVKGAGVDCSTLLLEVFHKAGVIPHLGTPQYRPKWWLHRDEEKLLAVLEPLSKRIDDPLPGVVATYRFGRAVSHAAIVIEWPKIVHVLLERGTVVGDATSDLPKHRFYAFYDVMGPGER